MRLPRRRAVLVLLATAVATTLGCGDFKALLSLADALQREYHTPVNLNVGGGHMSILFAQPPNAKLAPEQQEEFARDVARFARDHYADAAHLTDISVGVVQQSSVGPLTLTKTRVPFRFRVADLGDARSDSLDAAAADSAQRAAALSASVDSATAAHRLATCPGFVAARAGGVADSADVDPIGTFGVDAPAAVRYPASLLAAGGGAAAPTGRVTLEYVVGADGAPDMRTARVESSTGNPFTLAACDALRRSREPVAASARDGHALRTVRRRTFVIAPPAAPAR